MADASYKISVDLSGVIGANAALADAVFPLIGQAVRAVTEEATFRWKDRVMKAKLWSGEKAAYVESISWQMVNPWEGEIVATYPKAAEIETGRPSRDLKDMLLTSKKVRASKSGKHAGQKYLIIPFRHNVPTASGEGALAPQMPAKVYSLAKNLSASKVLPPGSVVPPQRMSASGHLVPQHSYQWGGRLPKGLMPKKDPKHVTDLYHGMVRFDTSTGKAKSSAYLTFRTMGEWSNGWIVGPRPGLYIAQKVAEEAQGLLDDVMTEAVTLGSLRK